MARPYVRKASWAAAILAAGGAVVYLSQDRLTEMLAAPNSETTAVQVRPAQPVRVTRVSLAASESTQSYTGSIRPQHEAPLSFRLAGQLTERLVDVGDRVAAGQIVARLDDTDIRLALAAAKATQDAARIDLARAEADVARSRTLFAAGHVAQAALDRAVSAAAEALSRADRADRASEQAVNQLSYASLKAETDGIVTAALAEPGQVVGAGQPVISVAMTSALDVVFALPEQHRDQLAKAAATAVLWGADDQVYALTLRDISPDVDPVGRTYRVRMTLTNAHADAAMGRTVTVHLTTTTAATMALPLAAVLDQGAGPTVWRLPAGADRVERVPVQIVGLDGQVARVLGPLAEGDLVVSLGAHKVDPARPVRVVETSPSPES